MEKDLREILDKSNSEIENALKVLEYARPMIPKASDKQMYIMVFFTEPLS